MERKEDEFDTLRQRIDKISSELDKQKIVKAVNTKWLIVVGTVILAFLGFSNFYQIPKEADEAAKKQVGLEIKGTVEDIIKDLKDKQSSARLIESELRNLSELDKISNLPLGSIIPSMLDPETFTKTVNDPIEFNASTSKWALADERNVEGSAYSDLINKKLPDLRGMFLRGMNAGRSDGNEDPINDRKVGDYQADVLKNHHHNTDAISIRWDKGGDGIAAHRDKNHKEDAKVSDAMDGKGKISSKETRPRNIAVYFYIKIN